jgi:hypothetical protein
MKLVRNILALVLAAGLLVSLLPAAAAAENDASVLTDLSHRNARRNTSANIGSAREIELFVRYSYPGETVNLADGLSISYDTGTYKNVVASSTAAAVGGSAQVTVTYNLVSEPDDAPKGRTDYTVHIKRAARIAPTFSGAIRADIPGPSSLPFTRLDLASKYTRNDGDALGYISVTGSNPAFGTLMLGAENYKFGTPVPVSSLGQLVFVATSEGTVSYDVTAYAGTDTTTPIGNVVLTITATSTRPAILSPITTTVARDTVTPIGAAFFTGRANLYGLPLLSVEIEPTNTAYGTWYLGVDPITAKTAVPASRLGSLTFEAKANGTATFNWWVTTEAGTSDAGTGSITVETPTLTLKPYTSTSSVYKGSTWSVSQSHFKYEPASLSLSYIKITEIPAKKDGYLYLTADLPKDTANGYAAIAANTELKANTIIPASYINRLRLSTTNTSTADQIAFKWTATTNAKATGAAWAEPTTYTVQFQTVILVKETDMNRPLVLSASEFENKLDDYGMALSYVTFTLPGKDAGSLILNYDPQTKKGTSISASTKYYFNKNPNISDISFVPAADYTGTVNISFKAYTENDYTIAGTLRITVENSPGGTLTLLTDKNEPLQLDAAGFSSAFKAATGEDLSHITFTSLSSVRGTLYYDFESNNSYKNVVSSGSVYYARKAPYISLVTFVPVKGYTGEVTIGYRGYDKNGNSYSGKLIINVVDSPGGIVSYSLVKNSFIRLSGNDFSNEFITVTGSVLSTVTFKLPPKESGTLYYQYDTTEQTGTAVSANTKYTDGKTPDISDITFVPAKDFVGTVVVTYTATSTTGANYTGKLKFIVTETAQTISLMTEAGKPVGLPGSSLLSVFTNMSGGKSLSYVTFELPSPAYGKLYYNYVSSANYDSAVSADKKYYVNAQPNLFNISFVPADRYNGTCTINYTGYATDGSAYQGKIKITVTNSYYGTVSYVTNAATPVNFSSSDFAAAFTEGTLHYVVFSLPHASAGTLYYDYSPTAGYSTRVTSSTAYYVNRSPYISSISFVPASGYTGDLVFSYTAYATSGEYARGTVHITVKSSDIDTLTYTTVSGKPVLFDAEDFNEVFLSRTGSSLNYVRFTLPDAAVGRLYLGYVSPKAYTAAVSASTRYYRGASPLLSAVSFVPAAGFTGTATISYTGYTFSGAAYSGKILIHVGSDTPFTDLGNYAWASEAISYLYHNGIVTGTGSNTYNPSGAMSRGDFVLMIARAFELSGGTDNFSDVPVGSYYYDAISAAKALGIVTGSGGKFSPAVAITRQDAMVIIKRVLDVKGIPISTGTAAHIGDFSDAASVSDYAVPAVASLVKAGIITGSGGKLNPRDLITRAEMAVILYRVVTL